jgi:hypothetical protein
MWFGLHRELTCEHDRVLDTEQLGQPGLNLLCWCHLVLCSSLSGLLAKTPRKKKTAVSLINEREEKEEEEQFETSPSTLIIMASILDDRWPSAECLGTMFGFGRSLRLSVRVS